MSSADLPLAYFAFPGPLRDQLVCAILAGSKTSTSTLALEFELENLPFPRVGNQSVVVDSDNKPVAIIEVIEAKVITIREVDLAHAIAEGEGYTSVAEWRRGHEAFWHSPEMRESIGDPHFTVTDDTLIVAERFKVVENLRFPAGA